MKKIILGIVLLVIVALVFFVIQRKDNETDAIIEEDVKSGEVNESEDKVMIIVIDDVTMSVTLEDNQTVEALLEMLPLEFEANDLNGNEKYYYLDDELPSDAVRVNTIQKGDIMLFGDDCLVIFYESFDTSYTYTKIGHIDDESLLDNISSGSVHVSIK